MKTIILHTRGHGNGQTATLLTELYLSEVKIPEAGKEKVAYTSYP